VSIDTRNNSSTTNAELRVGMLARDLLDESSESLPTHISERLAEARKSALAAHAAQKNLFGKKNGRYLGLEIFTAMVQIGAIKLWAP